MNVRELIIHLLNCPMDARVRLYDDRVHARIPVLGTIPLRVTEPRETLRHITDVTVKQSPKGAYDKSVTDEVILNGR